MIDVQQYKDNRRIGLDKVGVKGITYPIIVLDRHDRHQSTVATVNMYVDLPHDFKGTHMSRFLEVLNQYRGEMTMYKMPEILREMRERLGAEKAHLELEFPYFIEKEAPVSRARSLMDYTCRFLGTINHDLDFVMGVRVPVTSLCPCSREISRFGAHNQRSHVTVAVRTTEFVWLEELIGIVEQAASCELYSLLKREDEKFVTERAYENPVFVEDLARDVAVRLEEDPRVIWYAIEAENFESIHNHSAYASLEVDKRSR
ncbi:MAG: GTP cyclohydrolase I FolE2 [Acidobacteria bacterium]|nr:GTP cyclohydrolase I FolE2 [Acidobacteriota bacterium]